MIKDTLQDILATLTPRETRIIKKRHGIAPYTRTYTFKEIGHKMSVSGSRVRQIEQQALWKLRKMPRRLRLAGLPPGEIPKSLIARLCGRDEGRI